MYTARDVYTFTAGDIAAGVISGVCGRTYHHQLRAWRTINAADNIPDSPWESPQTHRLRAIQVIVRRAGPPIFLPRGLMISLWSITNPEHPDISTMLLAEDVQTDHHLVSWQGNYPMGSGLEYRIYTDGLIAADEGLILVSYE